MSHSAYEVLKVLLVVEVPINFYSAASMECQVRDIHQYDNIIWKKDRPLNLLSVYRR